jgi:hypothetical protein
MIEALMLTDALLPASLNVSLSFMLNRSRVTVVNQRIKPA